jgi:hypothetical protein
MEYLQQQRAEEVVCERREAPLHHGNAEGFVAVAANPAGPWQQPQCPQPAPNRLLQGKRSEPNDSQTMHATNMELPDPLNKGNLILLTQEGVAAAPRQVQAKNPSGLGNDANDAALCEDFKSSNMDTAHVDEAANEDIRKIQGDAAIAAQLPVVEYYSNCAKDANQVGLQDSVAAAARAKETNIVELPGNSVPNTVFMAPPADANVVSEKPMDETNDKRDSFLPETMPTASLEEASHQMHEGHGDATIALKVPANNSCMKDTNENEQRCGSGASTDAHVTEAKETQECDVPIINAEMTSRTDDFNVETEKPYDSPALDQHANHEMLHEDQGCTDLTGASEGDVSLERQGGQGDAASQLEANDATVLVKHGHEEILAGSCMTSIATAAHLQDVNEELQNAAMPSVPQRMSSTLGCGTALAPPATNDSPKGTFLQIPLAEGPPTAPPTSHDAPLHDYYKEGPSTLGTEVEQQILQALPPCTGPGPDKTPNNAQGSLHEVRPDHGMHYAKEKKRSSPSVTFLGAAINKKYRSHSLGSGQAPVTLVEGVESVLTDGAATMATGVPLELPDVPDHASAEYIRGLSVAAECCLDQVLNGVADRATMWQNAQVNEFVPVRFSTILVLLTLLMPCRRFGCFIPTAIYLRADCSPNEKWLVLC